MNIKQLTIGLHSTVPLLQKIAKVLPLSFDEAWSLVTPELYYSKEEDSPLDPIIQESSISQLCLVINFSLFYFVYGIVKSI